MIFLHPEFLYYMLPPLLILFLFLLTQKKVEMLYFTKEVMQKLKVSSNTLTLRVRNYIFLLIGVLLIVALANPVINNGTVEVKAKSSDIMIALDISDSMLAQDVYPNRLKLAKQKALSLLQLEPTQRIGIIGFAKNSYLVSPLSFDHSAVGFLLRQLNTDSITEKGTNFLSMLEVVQKSIKNKNNKKYLLLLSDGGDKKDFTQEIAYAKKHNIVVFVLAVGTQKGAPIKMENGKFIQQNGNIIVSKLNGAIAKLATKTGGVYIESVNSNEDIKSMMKEIEANSVKKELKSQEIHRYIPLFYYPLALALVLLLIANSSLYKKDAHSFVAVFLIALLYTTSQTAEAAVLDFMELKNAKEAYQNKNYVKSEDIYKKYLQSNVKPDVKYNIGNTLYKQGKYKEAIKQYKEAKFLKDTSNAKKLANIGNSYAKEPTQKNLEEAIKAYESSLKLHEDKDTRENLEAVKKALKKQKKQDKKKKDKKNKDKKNQNKDKKDQNKNQKDKGKKKDKQNKNDKSKKNSSEDEKKSNKNDKENKSKENQDKKQDKKQNSKEKQEKDAAKELKDDKKQEQKATQTDAAKMKMSAEEEKKWLKKLNKQQGTFLYRLNKKTSKQENENEKPW